MTTTPVRIDFLVTGNMSGLKAQVAELNASLMKTAGSVNILDRSMSNMGIAAANKQFADTLVTSNQYDHQVVTLTGNTEKFAQSLSRATLSGRQYRSEMSNFLRGRASEIRNLAAQQVRLQNSIVVPTSRSSTGSVVGSVITPTGLDKDTMTNMRLANKEWEIFNHTAQQGATQMVNWGKNTQWAGRQLMVGFTVPLMMAGGLAAKTFMDLDKEIVRLQKVYGSGLTFGDAFTKQSVIVREEAFKMADDMARAYGQAGTDTAALMADLAAAGFEGPDLKKMTEQTTKLSMLGEVDRQEAMKATIAIQTAFGVSTDQVAEKVNFLNAVENQTSTSLSDLVEAIPRAGTVVKGLGGSVEDLALYMTAFREGGISAAEGANALKSGLSSIIAPPKAAVEFMKEFGINLPKIVSQNQGNLTGTIVAFQKELMNLDSLARQQVITKLFGKYQFARMNAFFNNLLAKGSQTRKVLKLTGYSVEELAQIANQELSTITESASGRFNRAWQTFKVNIAEVGQMFLNLGTTALGALNNIFDFINNAPFLKQILTWGGLFLAVIGPIIMSLGLVGNMVGMLAKGVLRLVNFYKMAKSGGGISKSFVMLTADALDANHSIDEVTQGMYDQTKAVDILREALNELDMSYQKISESMMPGAAGPTVIPTGGGLGNLPTKTTSSGTEILNFDTGGSDPNQLARAHKIPRKMDKAQAKIVFSELVATGQMGTKGMSDATYAKAEQDFVNKSAKGIWLKMGAMGWDPQMAQTNNIAQNEPQFFRSTVSKNAVLTTKQTAAAQEAEIQLAATRMQMLEMVGNDQAAAARINQWYATSLEEVTVATELATSGSKDALTVQQAQEMHTRQMIRARATLGVTEAERLAKMGSKGDSFYSGKDSTWTKEADDAIQTRVLAETGLAASNDAVAKSNKQAIEAIDAESMSAEARAVAEKEVTLSLEEIAAASEQERAAALKRAASAKSLDQVMLLTNREQEALNREMQRLSAEYADTVVEFEILQSTLDTASGKGRKFAAAFDKATGKLLGISYGTTKGGGLNRSTPTNINDQALKLALEKRQQAEQKLTEAIEAERLARERSRVTTDSQTTAVRENIIAEDMETVANVSAARSEGYANAGSKGPLGFLGKFKNASPMMNGAAGASMILPMIASMVAPADSPVNGIANWAMMGSMAGMFGGPTGMVVGTAAGALVGVGAEIFKSMKEESDKQAAQAAAEWEAQFGKIDVSSAIADQLDLGNVKVTVAPTIDITGYAAQSNTQEFADQVATQFKDSIDIMKQSGEAAKKEAEKLFLQYVASGADPDKMRQVIVVALREAEQEPITAEVNLRIASITTEKQAENQLRRDIAKTQRSVMRDMVLQTPRKTKDYSLTPYDPSGKSVERLTEQYGPLGAEGGKVYATGFLKEVEAGMVPKGKYFSVVKSRLEEFISDTIKDIGPTMTNALRDTLTGPNISLTGNNQSQFMDDFLSKNIGDQNEIINRLNEASYAATMNGNVKLANSLQQQATAFLEARGGVESYKNELTAANPQLGEMYNKLLLTQDGLSRTTGFLQVLTDAQREYNNQLIMTPALNAAMAGLYQDVPNEGSIRKGLEKEAQAMTDAADAYGPLIDAQNKRVDALDREIEKINNKADREIEAINKSLDAQMKKMDKEEEMARRREELRTMEISYDEAVAEGDLFKAAQISINMAAIKKQQDQEDKRARMQSRADKKIKGIEKQAKAEAKLLEQQKKAHQKRIRMLEKEQQAQQDAAQAFSDSIDKQVKKQMAAQKDEIDSAEKHNALLDKMKAAMLAGDLKSARKYANQLKLDNKQFMNLLTAQFGEFSNNAQKALAQAIKTGSWALIGDLVSAMVGGNTKRVRKIWTGIQDAAARDAVKTSLSGMDIGGMGAGGMAAGAGYSTGGYVDGPGTKTSDSIPARLSKGEYVVQASSVDKYGPGFLDGINQGTVKPSNVGVQGFATGGLVGGVISGMLTAAGKSIMSLIRMGTETIGYAPAKTGAYGTDDMMFSAEQLENAAIIANVGTQMGASKTDIITAFATAMQESRLINVDYGADDSLGLFQQRPSMGWGTPKQVMDPEYASRQFFAHLLKIKDRDQMSIAEAAQAVQRSAYPSLYAQWVDEARDILNSMKITDIVPVSEKRKKMVRFAERQVGEPYIMGAAGPNSWDCSGLTMVAARHIGKQLAHSASLQQQSTHKISKESAMAGDLAFFNPGKYLAGDGTAGHVALMTGSDSFINAANSDLGVIAGNLSTTSNQFLNIGRIPGLRKGGRINYDNTIANLHRGETVLSRPVTNRFERALANISGGGYNLHVDKIEINNPSNNVDIEKALDGWVSKQERRMGRNRVIR